jgi:hypothetical protein
MPFEWYRPDVPAIDAARKATRMYELELAERAALLLRLGYSKQEATLRLRTNIEWDFELHEKPTHLDRVDAIVDRVYARRGLEGGGPPMLER